MISNHFLCKDWVHHPIDSQPFISMVGCKGFQGQTKIPDVFQHSFQVAGALPFCIDRSLERLAYRIEERIWSNKRIGASENIWREWKKQCGQIFCCQIFVDLQVLVVFLIIFKGLPSEETKVRPKGKTASGSQTFGRRSCEKLLLAIPDIFF